MATPLTSLAEIRDAVRRNQALVLDEKILGNDTLRLLSGACRQPKALTLTQCDVLEASPLFSGDHFVDLPAFIAKLRSLGDPVSAYLWNEFSASTQQILTSATSTLEQEKAALVVALNNILKGGLIFEAVRFAGVALSPETLALKSQSPHGEGLVRLNRLLLEDAYPLEIAKNFLEEGENHLICSGTFDQLFSWPGVNAKMALLDAASPDRPDQRHCVFRIDHIPDGDVISFVDRCLSSSSSVASTENRLARSLEDYVRDISFSEKWMAFSSVDYNAVRSSIPPRIDALMTLDAAFQVKAGINFPVNLTLDEDLERYIGEILGKFDSGGKGQGLIYWDGDGASVIFSKRIVAGPLIGDIGMELNAMSLVFPALAERQAGPRIVFEGAVSIKAIAFRITADFNAYYETLAVSFYEFPSLRELIDCIGGASEDPYFGEPLSSLLTVKLSQLRLVFGLRDRKVSEIDLNLKAERDVNLLEKVISFKPALEMQIYCPFDAELRSVEGKLEGNWRLGQTVVKTALYYPSFNFFAAMAPDQSLELSEVVKSIFFSIDLPKPEIEVKVTKMEVWGNFQNKIFSAEIDAVFEWQFALGGRRCGFQISKLLMAYGSKQVSCTLEGALKLADVDVLLSAEYDGDRGWMLSGGTPIGEVVNFTSIANDILESLSLHAKLPELKLTNIIFSAAPKWGEYVLRCEAAEDWELMQGVSLRIAHFTAEKRQGFSLTGLLRVRMTVAESELWLSAEKAAAGRGGWKFEGRSAEGKKIEIGKIVEWVGKQFGDTPRLPEAIEGFTVDKLNLSFESESQDFLFTCKGEVTLPGQKTTVEGVITIDVKHQDKSYTKLFGGSLMVDGMQFDLVFESAHKAGAGESRMFLAAYHDAKGHAVKIDDLIKRVVATPASTGLEITVKDALFAYRKTGKSEKYLFGLDIEGGLDLSNLNLPNLPLIGQAFPAGQTLKLTLQVLAAGSNIFTADEIAGLNRLNVKGTSLPQQEVKGLKLAALLRVGQETKPLSLPIGLGSPQGDRLVEDKTATPAVTANEQRGYVPSTNGTQWIKIQKTFGPIHVERVGIGYHSGNIALLLDSALTVAGLTLSLDGLGAEFALKDLAAKEFKPTFHLNGLGIEYRNGPLEIGGSFLEQKGTLTVGGKQIDYTSYAGLAVIRTAKLTLSAIGAYAQLNGRDPSLFIYAVANYPLGGPAFFFVTGFAGGFAYNRTLTLPPIEAIATFPLVAEAVSGGGPARLPSGQKEQQETLTEKLLQLEQYLPPSVGDLCVAVGIKFTSFKLIDSFALLVVQFGRRFEIDLLGLSTLTAPPPEVGKTVTPLAEAQLALKASFVPDEGFLGVRAQLTSNSYLFSKDAHLSGGLAFYIWFEPHQQAGDFVLTLGGYHPKFIAPDHYPKVPRLALNWQILPELQIKADAYFALTSSCIMAGAHLEATWQSGKLRAWLLAGADFLLAWRPYHYDVTVYISVGVSFTFDFFGNRTVTADLGADLHLWGPEFSGTVTIKWTIISFTISFGYGAPQELDPIDWNAFKASFLPEPKQICSVAVQGGLIRQLKAEGVQADRWIVNPKEMALAVNSAIPLNKVNGVGGPMRLTETDVEGKTKDLAIAPMGIESNLTSACSISITRDDRQPIENDKFEVRPIWKPMPAGLWGKPNLTDDQRHLRQPSLNGARLVEHMLTGFEVRPIEKAQPSRTCHIGRGDLQYTTELIGDAYEWREVQSPASRGRAAWQNAAKTAVHKQDERDQLLKALGLVNPVIDLGEPIDQGILLGV